MALRLSYTVPLGRVNGLPGPLVGRYRSSSRYRSSRCQASPETPQLEGQRVPRRNGFDPRPSAFQAGHIPSWLGSCERYALSLFADVSRWLLLLLSPLLSAAGPVPYFRGLPATDSVTPWSAPPFPGLFPATLAVPRLLSGRTPNAYARLPLEFVPRPPAPFRGWPRTLARLAAWPLVSGQSASGGSMSRVAKGHFRRKREAPLILRGSTSQFRGHPRT
jgi:hypothetical protein